MAAAVAAAPCRTHADLLSVGNLLRRAYGCAPRWNAWSVVRFDIWAQRRIADERLYGRSEWRDDLRLWHGPDGEPAAAAFLGQGPGDGVVITDPHCPELLEQAFEWVEERHEASATDEQLLVELRASNGVAQIVARRHGFARVDGHFLARERPLAPEPEPVPLPLGYRIRHLLGPDLPAFHNAVHSVFGRGGTVPEYEYVMQAPSYDRELGLVAETLDGRIGAFATVWVDRENGVAEFEPVGTVPGFRRLGLARAVMAEGCNRLRRCGCPLATVFSWSESAPANALYEAAGFKPADSLENWALEQA